MNNHALTLAKAYWEGEELWGPIPVPPDILGQRTCEHEWSDDPEPACVKCALVGEVMQIDIFQEGKPIRRHLHHQPKEYMKRKTTKLCGADMGDMWLSKPGFEGRVRRCETWPQVYALCASESLQESFLCIPAYMGHPVDAVQIFGPIHDIVYVRGYEVQFLYVAYKLAQLWGEDTQWIPLKATKPTLMKAEAEWTKVCAAYGLPLKKTYMSDLKTPWAP